MLCCNTCGLYLAFMLITCHTAYCERRLPNCKKGPDPYFKGSFLDCSHLYLTYLDLSYLPFSGTTTLDISYNNIGHLPDNAFERFNNLKRLFCTECNLRKMTNNSLKGLGSLEVLRLDYNSLKMKTQDNNPNIPFGVFRYVPILRELYIDNNGHYTEETSGYSHYLDIFAYLPGLTHLSIDSFRNLRIGEEFLNFSKLYSLRVRCMSMRSIGNDSFKGFKSSPVKMLELLDGNEEQIISPIGMSVFENLPNVSYLSLKQIMLGNQNVLSMMKPLVGRTIDTIKLDSVYSPIFGRYEDKVSDTVITLNDAQFLRDINVLNLLWYNTRMYSIEYDVPFSPTWRNNMRSLVFETEALTITSMMVLFEMMVLKKVEVIAFLWTVTGMRNQIHFCGDSVLKDGSHITPGKTISKEDGHKIVNKDRNDYLWRNKKYNLDFSNNVQRYGQGNNQYPSKAINDKRIERNGSDVKPPFATPSKRIESDHQGIFALAQEILSKNTARNDILSIIGGHLKFNAPPNLRCLIIDGFDYMKFNHEYIVGKNQLDSLVISNSIGILQLKGRLYGLENLTFLSLNGSQSLDLGLEFFDTFTNLRKLNLRKSSFAPNFYQTNSKRMIEKLELLEHLDLAENALETLQNDTFLTNNALRYFSLAKNRMSKIPFNLKFTPALEILDLSGNSFVDLSTEERAAIDSHILSVKNFVVFFGKNKLSCTCSKLPFIAWLQRRRHHFDQSGNYTCTSEGGTLSYTVSGIGSDAFWRICYGEYYLMMSGILACGFVAVFLGTFLGMKKKTEIISRVMQVVVPGFRLMTRRDYRFDVCIGYADQDGDYIRDVLLGHFDRWGYSRAFVHQRDLRQDPLDMSRALRDSWRCLLVVSEAFLYRYEMAHNVMKVASFFVSPSNPRSVVVMVEESVRHRIPDYVLQAVDEENIIVMPNMRSSLDYRSREFLRTRLS